MLRRALIVLPAVLLLAGPASAGTIVVKLGLVAGKLSVKSAPAQVTSAGIQVPLTVADGRGSGKGWTLRVASGATVAVQSITARCAAGSTCTLPAAVRAPSGDVVLQAARGTGMGVINLTVTLSARSATAVSFTVS